MSPTGDCQHQERPVERNGGPDRDDGRLRTSNLRGNAEKEE
jgi:hypothetical protein